MQEHSCLQSVNLLVNDALLMYAENAYYDSPFTASISYFDALQFC